jgi:exosortase/archaeosortase family protein
MHVIIIIYIYIIGTAFLVEFFDYTLWIHFVFTSAQKILGLMGYEAIVEPFHLVGANGLIYMSKGCLGFQTMLLFAILVFLTGKNNKNRWIYIITGLIFLNLVNIMRFVFLFIYLQKHGDYTLAMDVHDMYNYITYFIVFILWVVWFEKYAYN